MLEKTNVFTYLGHKITYEEEKLNFKNTQSFTNFGTSEQCSETKFVTNF
jgi:hypothetical protein